MAPVIPEFPDATEPERAPMSVPAAVPSPQPERAGKAPLRAPLSQRIDLNFSESFRENTITGSADLYGRTRVDKSFPADTMGGFTEQSTITPERKAEDDEETERIKDRLYAARVQKPAEGFVENAVGLAGIMGGSILSAETLLGPSVKVTTAAFAAARPVFSRMIGVGVGQAGVNVATEAPIQASLIAAGVQEHVEYIKALLAAPMGFVGGFGMEGLRQSAHYAIKGKFDFGHLPDIGVFPGAGPKPGAPRPEPRVGDDVFGGAPPPPPAPVRIQGDTVPVETMANEVTRAAQPAGPVEAIPRATVGAPLQSGTTYRLNVADLGTDAAAFQYKAGGDEAGVTTALKGIETFDEAKAGRIIVWQGNDGRLIVADGHQRTGLARRLMAEGKAPADQGITALVYREADGYKSNDVKAIAAAANLATGTGTATDAAKILKSRPDLMDGTLPPNSQLVRDAKGLAKLGDDSFSMVVNEVVPERYGAMVGDAFADPNMQSVAMRAIHRADPANADEAAILLARIKVAAVERGERGAQGSLFGDMFDSAESTVIEEMKIVGRSLKGLKSDATLFRGAVKKAERLEATGSTIERGATSAAADEAARAAFIAEKAFDTAGPIREALTRLAAEVKTGKTTLADASKQFSAAVKANADTVPAAPKATAPDPPDKLLVTANKIAADWQKALGGDIEVVNGGSIVARTYVQTGKELPDLDIRFLTDNPERDYPKVEAVTGLKLRKTIQADDFPSGKSTAYLVEGSLTRDGITFDVEAMVRTRDYVGWGKFYPEVLSPAELAAFRADKARLKDTDKPGYKTLKADMLQEVRKRVGSRSRLEAMIERGATPEEISAHPIIRTALAEQRGQPAGPSIDEITPEYRAARVFQFDGEQVVGYGRALPRLIEGAEAFAGGPVATERRAVIVLGPPASGKSRFSETLALQRKAAIVDPDEAKNALPEFKGGIGSSAVHEESSHIAGAVLEALKGQGKNVVIPKVGADTNSIRGIAQDLQARGYTVDVVHMAVTPDEAFRRMIRRFLDTGRLIDKGYFDAVGNRPLHTYNQLKKEGYFNEAANIDNQTRASSLIEGSARLAEEAGIRPGGRPGRDGIGGDAPGARLRPEEPGSGESGPVRVDRRVEGGEEAPGLMRAGDLYAHANGFHANGRPAYEWRPEREGAALLTRQEAQKVARSVEGTKPTFEPADPPGLAADVSRETIPSAVSPGLQPSLFDAPLPAGTGKEALGELLASRKSAQRPSFAQGRGGAGAAPADRVTSPQQSMRTLADRLDTIISDERLHLRGAGGEYDPAAATVRLRSITDVDTFTHEVGHHIDFRAGQPLRQVIGAHMAELYHLIPPDVVGLATTQRARQAEAFAEFINRFLINEQAAARDAPTFTQAFTSFMQAKHPDMLADMLAFRAAYQAWENAPSGVALRSTIVKPAEVAASAGRQTGNPMERSALGEFFYRFRLTNTDKMEAVNELARAVAGKTGKVLGHDEHATSLLRRASHAAERSTEVDYSIGIGGRPHEITVQGQKVHYALRDVVEGFSADPKTGLHDPERALDADAYLRSRRSLSLLEEYRAGLRERRPDQFPQVDHENMVRDMEAKYPAFKPLADMLSVIHTDDVVRQFDKGLITVTQRDELLKNQTYVPFRRDMRLNEGDVVGGGSGSGKSGKGKSAGFDNIKRLEGSDRDIISPLSTFMQQLHETNVRVRINEAVGAVADHIRLLGPDGAKIGEEIVLTKLAGSQVDVLQALRAKAKEINAPREDIDRIIATAEDFLNGNDAATTLFRSERLGPSDVGGKVLMWREAGEVKALILRDTPFARDIYSAVESIGRPMVDMVNRFAANIVNTFRVGATGNPTFAITNTVADAFTSTFTDFRRGRTGTLFDYVPGLPMAKGLATSVKEMAIIAARDAFELAARLPRQFGYDWEWPKGYATLERAMLAREGLIGTSNAQFIVNMNRANVDPLKALGIPGYSAGERPIVETVAAVWRGMRSDTPGAVAENLATARQLIRDIAEEKYGVDAPTLGLRIARDYVVDGAKLLTLDPLKTVFGAFKYLGEISEPAGRYASARDILRFELRSQGVSKADFRAFLLDPDAVTPEVRGKAIGSIIEAVGSANGTADFQRQGTMMLGASRLVAFLNSNVQGLAAHADTVKAMLSPEAWAVTRKQQVISEQRLYGIWQLSALIGGSTAYAILKTTDSDERWQNSQHWKRLANWIIPVTSEFNLTIRKPYEWRAYINMGEAMGEYIAGRGEFGEMARKMSAAIREGLTPPSPFSMGPVTDIPQAIQSNYDAFRQKRIIPENIASRSPQLQYASYTPEVYKSWAKFWNKTVDLIGLGEMPQHTRNSIAQVLFSPMMAEYAAKSMFAGSYTDVRGAVMDPLQGRPADAATLPISRAFMEKSVMYGAARAAVADNISRYGGRMVAAVNDFKAEAAEGRDPQAHFQSLKPDQQAYVAMMVPERRNEGEGVKKLHPMERERAVAKVLNETMRMIDQGRVAPLDDPRGGFTISDQFMRKALRETTGRILELEARNALILSGDAEWKGAAYKTKEVEALYDKLHALDPRVHNEIANRYATEKVFKFSALYDPETGKGLWADISKRLREEGGSANLRGEAASARGSGFELEGSKVRKVKDIPAPAAVERRQQIK